jgi:3-hydroxy acid dehydrogenase/malonic semialdehyde reductase
MNPIAFISGASSGIGEACAHRFAEANYDLIICGRRLNRLLELKSSLEEKYKVNVMTLSFDVRLRDAVHDAINSIPTGWQNIKVLINNAGLSLGRDNFSTANLDDWDTMLQTNVNGLIYVTKALMPCIKTNQTHIVNIGSIAGKEVYENGNVYCASKFAVDALSKSMRIDLLKHGIKVTAIHPGAAETEFSLVRYKGDSEKAASVYKGMQPLVGKDIADVIFYTTQLPAHVCINELTIMPTQQASSAHFHRTENA